MGQGPKTIAVVDERFGSDRQFSAGLLRIRRLKCRDQWVVLVEDKRASHVAPFHSRGCAARGGELGNKLAKFLLDRAIVAGREPATRPFEPAFLRVLIVDL